MHGQNHIKFCRDLKIESNFLIQIPSEIFRISHKILTDTLTALWHLVSFPNILDLILTQL